MGARGLRSVAGLCAAIAAIAVMAVWSTARADVDNPGFYLGFRALPAFAVVEDEAIAGGPGGAFGQLDDALEAVIGVGVLIGYHWQRHGLPIRTEIEYAHRFRLDFDTEAAGPPQTGYKNDLSTDSVMFSTYVDFNTGTPWRPYLGAGIGWARNSSKTLRTNLASGASQEIENDADNFAFSLQAGVRVAITRSWVGEIGYRYIDMGEINSGRFATGDVITADNHVSHDFILGIAYLF